MAASQAFMVSDNILRIKDVRAALCQRLGPLTHSNAKGQCWEGAAPSVYPGRYPLEKSVSDIRHLIPKSILTHKAVNKDRQPLWCKSNYPQTNESTCLGSNLLSAVTGSSFFFFCCSKSNPNSCMHDMEQSDSAILVKYDSRTSMYIVVSLVGNSTAVQTIKRFY